MKLRFQPAGQGGYEVGSQTASPEKVKITGPKSLVNKIDKVNATVDVDGRTKDFSEGRTEYY